MREDITGRRQEEEDLLLYRILLSQSNDAIFVIDPDTGQFFLNAFLTYNGLLPSDVVEVDMNPSELPGALVEGQIDAIVIWEPHAI